MDGLLESLERVDVEVVGSELEALLLESQLIKRYQPRYNTALRSFEQYPYIRVDLANPWPRVTLAKVRKDDGSRYFGPFRSPAAARKTVDVLNRVLPLRTCSRSFRDARSYGSPCLELDLGRCLGPCVGRADREVYAALVHDLVSFLDGRDLVLYERLWRGLEESAERLDFERAAELRRDLQRVNAVVGAQRRLREASEAARLVVVLPSAERGAREVLIVAEGRLWAQIRAPAADGAAVLAERLGRCWERLAAHGARPVAHDSVDEANILGRWLREQEERPGLLPLPPEPDWGELAGRILALSDGDLAYAKPKTEVAAAEEDV
jgi:excinuclease UvrABC nuclease subunit